MNFFHLKICISQQPHKIKCLAGKINRNEQILTLKAASSSTICKDFESPLKYLAKTIMYFNGQKN